MNNYFIYLLAKRGITELKIPQKHHKIVGTKTLEIPIKINNKK